MADAENPDYEDWNPDAYPPLPAPLEPEKQSVHPESDITPAPKDEESTERRIREWALVAINVVLAGAGVFALWFYWGQLDVMKGQLGEIVKQYPEMQRQATAAEEQLAQVRSDSAANAKVVEQQLKIAGKQTQAAQASVSAVQRQTFQEERPWVAVSVSPASGFNFDKKEGGIIMMRYTLTNVGHSLAKYVSVWTALDLNGGWKDAQDRICSYPKLPQNSKSDYGYLLFPGQTVLDQTPAQATSEDVTRALNPTVSPLAIKKMVAVDIVVCVDYVSTIDMQHHQTRLVRGVLSDEGTENAALVGTFVADRQYGKLAFVPHLHGDSAD